MRRTADTRESRRVACVSALNRVLAAIVAVATWVQLHRLRSPIHSTVRQLGGKLSSAMKDIL